MPRQPRVLEGYYDFLVETCFDQARRGEYPAWCRENGIEFIGFGTLAEGPEGTPVAFEEDSE